MRERRKRPLENQDEEGWLVGHFTNFLLPPSLEVDGPPPAELYAGKKKTLPHFLVFCHRRRLRLSRKGRRKRRRSNERTKPHSPPRNKLGWEMQKGTEWDRFHVCGGDFPWETVARQIAQLAEFVCFHQEWNCVYSLFRLHALHSTANIRYRGEGKLQKDVSSHTLHSVKFPQPILFPSEFTNLR